VELARTPAVPEPATAKTELLAGGLVGGRRDAERGSAELRAAPLVQLDREDYTRHGNDVWRFYVLRSLSILGGVAITALSGIGLSGSSSSPGIRWTIFALGFLVAGSAAMEQLGHYGQHRMLSRQAREELLTVGFGYLLPEPAPAGFDEFRQLVEGILGKYNDSYNRTLSGQ
jgi:hypothetical protein